jgi:ABC-2 type transport system ATP-binding protein
MELIAENLAKRYGTLDAVIDVGFAARPGEVLGLLGPNGAGKSTTVSIIAGLVSPDRGTVRIGGDVIGTGADPVKRRIGLVPQEIALIDELPAHENLVFFGSLYGLSGRALRTRVDEALTLVQLSDRAKDLPREFSGGMRRRLNLAAALIHDPAVLLLDEPTVGVDPQSRNSLFETIESLAASGHTILYTTHYMAEVERLCKRVVVIDHGRVLADDTLTAVVARAPEASRLVLGFDIIPDAESIAGVAALPGVTRAELIDGQLHVVADDLGTAAPRVLERISARGLRCRTLQSRTADLEDAFLALTGRTLRDP